MTAAVAVVAAANLTPAAADPALPPNASEALKKYNELTKQAEKLNEDHLRAQEDLKAKQGDLDKARADLGTAKQAEESLRGQVDVLTEATFKGARFNQLSALLVSDSQQDFFNRLSALGILAADNAEALDKLTDAVAKADDAQRRAQEATHGATKAAADITRRKSELDSQVTLARY